MRSPDKLVHSRPRNGEPRIVHHDRVVTGAGALPACKGTGNARFVLDRCEPIDHVVTALLTAAVMDVIGGVAHAELLEEQVPIVTALPGVIATMTEPWPAAYGSAEFLRAWARQPGFRLLK